MSRRKIKKTRAQLERERGPVFVMTVNGKTIRYQCVWPDAPRLNKIAGTP